MRRSLLPTIFLVGDQDPRVPMPQSVEMYRALKSNGVPTHLYVAPREGHGWTELRHRLFASPQAVAKEYNLNPEESKALETVLDENIDSLRSLKPHPLVDAGAHPLGMLMSLVVVQAEMRRLRAAGELQINRS